MKEEHGCLLVSFDFENDVPIVLVGNRSKTVPGDVDIINAFQDEEARALFDTLTTVNYKKG